jgi:hypothetical protein
MRFEMGEPGSESLMFETERMEGRGSAKMLRRSMRTVEARTKMPGQPEIQLERDVAEDTILGAPLVSTYVAINNRISSLEVGRKIVFPMIRFEVDPEFEIIEANLSVERKESADKEEGKGKVSRVYTIKDTRTNGSYEATLVMDEQGRPMSLESVGQMGGLRAELIEPLGN